MDNTVQLALFLQDRGVISDSQYSRAKSTSDESGKDVIPCLIDFGYVDESTITHTLSSAYGLEIAEFDFKDVPEEALQALPEKFIIENRVIPFALKKGSLKVAISEPNSLNQMSAIQLISGFSIETFFCSISLMNRSLKALDSSTNDTELPSNITNDPISSSIEKPAGKKAAKTNQSVSNKNAESDKNADQARSSIVIDTVNQIIAQAIDLGVSDIHIEPFKHSSRVRYRLDGVLKEIEELSKKVHTYYSAVSTRLKIMSKLDIAERRLPQDGAITFETSDKREIDIRVSILPTAFGERIVMRLLDHSGLDLKLEALGMGDAAESKLKKAVDAPQGLVLVTGPTGSGKSTTLYSVLNRINNDDINILTAEDPVEYVMEGVGQVQVKDSIGLTFTSALRSFLRQDPEVILVGEIRDKDTADIAIKAALTGHLVLSTLHTNDAVSTVTRLVNMGVPPYLLTASLSLVVAQRLSRKICPDCKAPDDNVSSEQLLGIGFSAEEISQTIVYKGQGCATCNNTGYKGRQGIYEVLQISPAIKRAIIEGQDAPEMMAIAKSEGFQTMQKIGKGFVQQGIITPAEYQRVLTM